MRKKNRELNAQTVQATFELWRARMPETFHKDYGVSTDFLQEACDTASLAAVTLRPDNAPDTISVYGGPVTFDFQSDIQGDTQSRTWYLPRMVGYLIRANSEDGSITYEAVAPPRGIKLIDDELLTADQVAARSFSLEGETPERFVVTRRGMEMIHLGSVALDQALRGIEGALFSPPQAA